MAEFPLPTHKPGPSLAQPDGYIDLNPFDLQLILEILSDRKKRQHLLQMIASDPQSTVLDELADPRTRIIDPLWLMNPELRERPVTDQDSVMEPSPDSLRDGDSLVAKDVMAMMASLFGPPASSPQPYPPTGVNEKAAIQRGVPYDIMLRLQNRLDSRMADQLRGIELLGGARL